MAESLAPVMVGPDFDRDPSPVYALLRRQAPAYRLPLPGGAWTWLLTRHTDVAAALADPRLAKSPAAASPQWTRANLGLPADHRASLARHMNNVDGADHQRLRKACVPAFSPGRLQKTIERTAVLAGQLAEDLAGRATADLVGEYAVPLAMASICELIGIPQPLVQQLHHPAKVIVEGDLSDMPGLLDATDAIEQLCGEVITHHRTHPDSGPSLVTDLLAGVDAGGLSEDEVAATVLLTVIAGHETTASAIASTLLALLTEPDHRQRAATEPEHLALCVEEVLRRDCPVQNATWRFATVPMTLAGQAIAPGDPVLLSLLAASRDPDTYPDPDTFRPDRGSRHLAFGRGPHVCIGAALARTTTTTAVATVLTRLPGMTLAEPAAGLGWWPSVIIRGLQRLPVTTGTPRSGRDPLG